MRLLALLTLLTACDSTCGTSAFWVGGDSYVGGSEPCGAFGGSFALHYPNAPYTRLLISPDGGATDAWTALVLDLTPGTTVTFRTDHLVAGTDLDTRHLVGSGFHDPTASGQLPVEQPLTFASLRILDGPRTRGDREEFLLDWNLTYGDLAEPHQGGFQRHDGEAWVHFDTGFVTWESGTHTPPPDAG